jgi:hypothetical protein
MRLRPTLYLSTAALLLGWAAAWPQSTLKRPRADDYYACESANVPGWENLWLGARGISFIWDNDPRTNQAKLFNFLEADGTVGMYEFIGFFVNSRLVSYPWNDRLQFGHVGAGARVTLPNTDDLRLLRPAVQIEYRHTAVAQFPSIAGYRQGPHGFSAEGFTAGGGALRLKAMGELDLIAAFSRLPVKAAANLGLVIPLDNDVAAFKQYLFSFGLAYVGLTFDFFLEYSLEAFLNRSPAPKLFVEELGTQRRWEVSFMENPMYLTPGGRVRYDNGLVLYCFIPLLLSQNRNSSIVDEEKFSIAEKFPEEFARGARDAFEPWYTKWKVLFGIEVPVRYTHTSAEVRRNFLLMKNMGDRRKINIDRRIETAPGSDPLKAPGGADDDEDRKRLEEIRRRREALEEKVDE